MERFCGLLLGSVKNRSKPYANLSRRLLHWSQLSQIRHVYGLYKELDFDIQMTDISSKECIYPECKIDFQITEMK